MPELNFTIEGVQSVPHATAPLLAFGLRVTNSVPDQTIGSIILRSQIQIETTRRHYSPQEQEAMLDLFGEPERWSQTLGTLLWTHVITPVPAFSGEAAADLLVPCTFDFNVAATKYFHGLQTGDLPLVFQFSGTVFYQDQGGPLQFAPIPWDKESRFRLPSGMWRELMDLYYPNSSWITLRKDVFERLYEYKVRSAIPTWEQTIERILASVEEPVRP